MEGRRGLRKEGRMAGARDEREGWRERWGEEKTNRDRDKQKMSVNVRFKYRP